MVCRKVISYKSLTAMSSNPTWEKICICVEVVKITEGGWFYSGDNWGLPLPLKLANSPNVGVTLKVKKVKD